MNDRERWIVYPLLFLALGAALRDKLAKQTRAKEIVCETLYLVDNEGRPMAYLTGSELRFDQAGRGNGFVWANTIDAETLAQRGQRIAPQGATAKLPLQDLLRMLPQFRLPPGVAPANPEIQPNLAPPTDEAPQGPAGPPGAGPALQPPADPSPETESEPAGDA